MSRMIFGECQAVESDEGRVFVVGDDGFLRVPVFFNDLIAKGTPCHGRGRSKNTAEALLSRSSPNPELHTSLCWA